MLWAQQERTTVIFLRHLIKSRTRWCGALEGPEQNALGNLLVLRFASWVASSAGPFSTCTAKSPCPFWSLMCGLVAIKRLAAFGSSCAEDSASNRTGCISQDSRLRLQLLFWVGWEQELMESEKARWAELNWILQFSEHIMLRRSCVPICIFFFLQFSRTKAANVQDMQREARNWITDGVFWWEIFFSWLIEERFRWNYMAQCPQLKVSDTTMYS